MLILPEAFPPRDAASTAARSWTRKISCRNLHSNHGELRRITQKKHDTIIYNPSKYLMPPKILVWSWICSFCRPHKGGLLILGACSAPKMDDQLEKFTEKMSRSLKWRVNHQRLQPQYGRFDYWVPTRVAINDRMTQYARSFPWVFDHPHLGTPMTWARRGAGSDDVDFETFDKAWEMRGATGEKHPPAHRHTFVYIFSYIYDMIYIYTLYIYKYIYIHYIYTDVYVISIHVCSKYVDNPHIWGIASSWYSNRQFWKIFYSVFSTLCPISLTL
jgi:hypothetical protein